MNVKERRIQIGKRPMRIIAPTQVLQNERVIFMADGDCKDWRWEFGETGDVDSQNQNPIYSYSKPGSYEIRLSSETTKYPIVHQIEVLPENTESDSSDAMMLIASDIQEHLQNIVDKGSFNKNYNYILKKYLGNNPNVMVLVNGDKENDFYSYCYGLKIVGKQNSTWIDEVVLETDKEASCVKRLLVSQNSLKEKL
ncbi:MAG TPA: PKD domain-containing protein [Paludibacteraceae bacterium]|nr:PKD domain-containing protein [Paludibacteraceae bacterium]